MKLLASEHFANLKAALEREAAAERAEFTQRLTDLKGKDAEKTGNCLVGLSVEDEYLGFGGRSVLALRKKNQMPLPWNRLETGSPVFLSGEGVSKPQSQRGVIVQRRPDQIHVAFDESWEEADAFPALRIDLAFDEISRRREREALDRAIGAKGSRTAVLRDVMMGEAEPRFERLEAPLIFFNENLNPNQRAAVQRGMEAADLAIVHGPPGTGKTTTLVEIVRQSVKRGEKVLVTAPSNLGVDHLLEKLARAGEKVVRLGHPARVMEHLQDLTLDGQLESHPDTKLARGLFREASVLFRQARRYTRAAPAKGARQASLQEARALLADARQLERRAAEKILDAATVILATATGVESGVLGKRRFDLALLDEAAQATEPTAWIPLLRAERFILGGDHCQLPPTLLSDDPGPLARSLMERLVQLHGSKITTLLELQYRMHQTIMEFPSHKFYGDRLLAHPSVATHTLADLALEAGVYGPMLFIDTAGGAYSEEEDQGGRSNEQEALYLGRVVDELLACGLKPDHIALISPYANQVRLLRELLPTFTGEIDTIDGFQGREKEVVLLSLVRSNDDQEIGFLRETRRINVAMTRARRYLLLIGDSATLGGHPFFGDLIDFCQRVGAYRSIWE